MSSEIMIQLYTRSSKTRSTLRKPILVRKWTTTLRCCRRNPASEGRGTTPRHSVAVWELVRPSCSCAVRKVKPWTPPGPQHHLARFALARSFYPCARVFKINETINLGGVSSLCSV